MAGDLDARFDAMLETLTAADGAFPLSRDANGRGVPATLPATLPGFYRAFCRAHGAIDAVVAGPERLSFTVLDALSDRVARALVARAIVKGDRVGIAMRNCPAWILLHMGIAKAGGIVVLVNGWWLPHEMAQGLALTTPKLVVADAARAARIAEAGWSGAVVVLPIEASAGQAIAPLGDAPDDVALPEVSPEDDATILFTSGSTGEAKGAVSTHRAVTTATYAYTLTLATMKALLVAEGRPPRNPPATLLIVPLFHVTGEVPVMLNSFAIGRKMVVMPRWDAGEALRLIEAETITYFVGVPTMSMELTEHPDVDRHDLRSLTDIASGGAPRPVAHVPRLQARFPSAQPAQGYGLTETNAVGCGNFWSSYAARPASCGRAQPLVEVAILGTDDAPVQDGETGEIAIRSAGNIRGYWGEDAHAPFTADGYLRTGDLGWRDGDGYVFIVDRAKDIIIRGGENICCQQVEAALYADPAVVEACVFGLADARLGEVPGAVLHLRAGTEVGAVRDGLALRLARHKLPAMFWTEEVPLPKLGTGKIDKVALRARYRALAERDALN